MGFPVPDNGEVTEDVGVVGGFLTTTGDIDFGPFLNGDAGLWIAETIAGIYGSQLVIDSDGNWTYTADNSNATIQALDSGDSLTEVFTVSSARGSTTITVTINGADEPPCFVAGTLIDTPQGARLVEDLQAGDMVYPNNTFSQFLLTVTCLGLARICIYSYNLKHDTILIHGTVNDLKILSKATLTIKWTQFCIPTKSNL